VKLEGQTMKHGVWNYYETQWGGVVKTERYFLDRLQTGLEADADLQPIGITDTKAKSDTVTTKKTVQKPQAVLDYEKKNSGKKKVKVRDGRTGY
jgi:hypothetical protein